MHVEFAIDVSQMPLDGTYSDHHLLCDLQVRHPGSNEVQYLYFAFVPLPRLGEGVEEGKGPRHHPGPACNGCELPPECLCLMDDLPVRSGPFGEVPLFYLQLSQGAQSKEPGIVIAGIPTDPACLLDGPACCHHISC